MNQARFLAHRSLTESLSKKSYSNRENDRVLKNTSLSPEDRSLYTQLYYGTIEKKITIDYILSQISTFPLNQCTPSVLSLLELGAYQILYLDRIPDHSAVFESVEIAKISCRESVSFINAVLRKLSQTKESVPALLDSLSGKKGLAIRYGYPKGLVTLWQEAYGKERCESILKEQNFPAALTLRIHTGKISTEEYSAILTKNGICHHRNPLCKHGITLEKSISPLKLPGYDEGLFFIQDAAAQHAIDRLEVQPGERVLDLCSAPGGKSFAALLDMKEKGQVYAREFYASRAKTVKEGARRLGLDAIEVEKSDSSIENPCDQEQFHRVICDVPCSGYGTIAKKPDIRHKNLQDAEDLPHLQYQILSVGARATKPGGRILYSTCTLNPKENEDITDTFLKNNNNFIRIGEKETIFPKGGENDGFFCDILEKIK